MRKVIEKLYGAKAHASAKNIKGKKSSGREDTYAFQHWENKQMDPDYPWD